ncbi:MAG: ribosome biogenesis GTPase Der [Candidatus Gastranaerophilales bacterium]|nr:ribosome biogenesis GTPase Der [Candidatus Gastranaerophilales bacterium]
MSRKREIVAIVGRPNVGKSTFVNRLVGARKSIVDDAPGVTRDRIYFDVSWCGKDFTVIDTGGIIPNDEDEIMKNIFAQVELALDEADKIIFMVDAKDGINPIDIEIANFLRRSKKPIFLTANKVDTIDKSVGAYEFYQLALGEPYIISALHGSGGVGDLLDKIIKDIEEDCSSQDNETSIKIAIVGRPNAGKSSIVNAVLNENRLIVSDISGTTRDSINSKLKFENDQYTIIDTAGIRKKSKVDYGVEKFAVDRSIRSIRDCDIAILVIDATVGLTDQDKKISQIIVEAGKGIILAVNKWDIVENKDAYSTVKYEKKIESEAPFLNFVPKIFISALTKQRINTIFIEAKKVYEQYKKRISTSLLNKIVNEAYVINPPTSFKGKRLKIYYSTQVCDSPPTFVIFINDKKLVKDSYKRYLENQLREAFGFIGVPFRISFRERGEDKRK